VLALCPPDHVGVGREHGRQCRRPGKSPLVRWRPYQNALPSEREVRSWWHHWPNANVGMTTGSVVRLDLEGAAAHQLLRELSHGDLPPTWSFRSGRPDDTGLGVLYWTPPGLHLRTAQTRVADGELRFLAHEGVTVLPPSRHWSGSTYAWLPGHGPEDLPLAVVPGWAINRWSARAAMAPARSPAGPRETGCGGSGRPAEVFLALVSLHDLHPLRADAHDDWLHVGMALHAVSPDLLDEWDNWSQQAPHKYQPGHCARRWSTFGRRPGYGLGDLLEWARLDRAARREVPHV
jgi:hypothetical protein